MGQGVHGASINHKVALIVHSCQLIYLLKCALHNAQQLQPGNVWRTEHRYTVCSVQYNNKTNTVSKRQARVSTSAGSGRADIGESRARGKRKYIIITMYLRARQLLLLS